jgi:hypothetical protein
MQNNKIISELDIEGEDIEEEDLDCIAANSTRVIFQNENDATISIYKHDTKTIQLINKFDPGFYATYESVIIPCLITHELIAYLVHDDEPIISKYSLSGAHIEDMKFEKSNWESCHVRIHNDEIIMYSYSEIIFYDLNCNELAFITMDRSSSFYSVTSNYMYIKYDDENLHIYERII